MKKLTILVSLISIVMLLGLGCAAPYSPGFILSDYDAPQCAPDDASGLDVGSKVGKSQMVNYLGWIAQGDASIQAAAENGGISKIKTSDYHYDSLLGIVNTTTTIVTGD